ncbi:hypothetical protein OYT88_19895 [Sporolactobacillus sp. CQH2019]|uniref:hypothetical protein n=1 Tax=Sporolactobacillus sp. CQH2019 TaxID=3023512 RepID=UPI002367727E|nr:hypothetical protein [Sporolactobacillus sp. CQH2019]MDD9150785.1 hypothetical protein [Sporolactobacillus sp. CQH2019]
MIRDLALNPNGYESLIHFFRSSAWSLADLHQQWLRVVLQYAPIKRKEVMETLGIDVERYAPIMFTSIGKASKPAHESVRLPIERVVSWNQVDQVMGSPAKK